MFYYTEWHFSSFLSKGPHIFILHRGQQIIWLALPVNHTLNHILLIMLAVGKTRTKLTAHLEQNIKESTVHSLSNEITLHLSFEFISPDFRSLHHFFMNLWRGEILFHIDLWNLSLL